MNKLEKIIDIMFSIVIISLLFIVISLLIMFIIQYFIPFIFGGSCLC